jgi:hypothetical protein
MKKLNNKVLLIALVLILSVFILSRWLRSPGLESTLPQQLVTLDTARITKLTMLGTSTDSQQVVLTKEGNTWFVSNGRKKVAADVAVVKTTLGSLTDLKPQRLASRKKDKRPLYQVDDTGTRVAVYYDEDKKAEMIIGKSSYSQAGAFTYARMSDEDEVYTVDGTLAYQFNRAFDEWRNKSLLRVNKEEIHKIIFQYPSDSSFVLEKRDSLWYVNDIKADVGKTNTFLSQLAFKNGNAFADDFVANAPPTINIQIESKLGVLANVKGWMVNADWIVSSSTQENVFFSAAGTPIIGDLFIGKEKLLLK